MKVFMGSLLSLLMVLGSDLAYAVELGEVVVTGSYTEMQAKESGSTIEVIQGENLEKQGIATLTKAIEGLKGVDIASNGITGKKSIFIRGFESKYAVVMIDGVRVYDPSTGGRDFDINGLDLNNVDKIEVLKGVQSSIYGADAVAGVINIITKKGSDDNEYTYTSEFGSHDSFRESASARGIYNKLSYSFGASRFDTDGISSAVKTNENNVSENDGYSSNLFSGRLDYDFTDNISVGINARYSRSRQDHDDGAYNDDTNKVIKSNKGMFSLYFDQQVNDLWRHNIKFSSISSVRQYYDGSDEGESYSAYMRKSLFKGRNESLSWNNNFYLSDIQTVNVGYQYDKERFFNGQRGTTFNRGYYLENKLALLDNHFFNTISLRADDHSRFGTHRTFKTDFSYLFDSGTRLKANWGTGFKAPSLYQLYDSSNGNQNLKPEEVKGFEFGVEQELLDNKIKTGITYFHNKIKNKIDWVNTGPGWSGEYQTISGITTNKGVEAFIDYSFNENLDLNLSYTYLDASISTTSKPVTRRARNHYGFLLNYRFLEKGNVSFAVNRYLARYEEDGYKGPSYSLKNYTKADLSAAYDITDYLNVFARIENLFDEKYTLARGYSTEGRSLNTGIKLKF